MNLQAQRQLVDPGGQGSNLTVRQDARVIRVDFVKHIRDVELLLGAHEEVEVREGELHVLRVTDAVGRRLVELLREPEDENQQSRFYCLFCCFERDAKVFQRHFSFIP